MQSEVRSGSMSDLGECLGVPQCALYGRRFSRVVVNGAGRPALTLKRRGVGGSVEKDERLSVDLAPTH